jgi:hypothetical protein
MQDFFQENKWFILIAILITFTPVALNLFFLYGDVDTGEELGNVEWLAFWGSYLGGTATLIAVYLTLNQNMQVIKQNEQIIIQNQHNLIFQEERSRVTLMPYIDVRVFVDKEFHMKTLQPPNGFIILSQGNSVIYKSVLSKNYQKIIERGMIEETESDGVITSSLSPINFILLVMTQKAPSIARNIKLSVHKKGKLREKSIYLTPDFVMASGEIITLPILFDKSWPEGDYCFILSLKDIEGRQYEQCFSIQHKGMKGYSFYPVSSPKLVEQTTA